MVIYRVLEQGWGEAKALEEATKIGLSTEGLKKFAQDYIAQHKRKRGLKIGTPPNNRYLTKTEARQVIM
jgi:hypothetical protein